MRDGRSGGPTIRRRSLRGNRRWEVVVAVPDFTVVDQNGDDWTLGQHLDTARLIVFLRGDW